MGGTEGLVCAGGGVGGALSGTGVAAGGGDLNCAGEAFELGGSTSVAFELGGSAGVVLAGPTI